MNGECPEAVFLKQITIKSSNYPYECNGHSDPDGYAVLMRPDKPEAAVHGCHCPGDMVVCMPEAMAITWTQRQNECACSADL